MGYVESIKQYMLYKVDNIYKGLPGRESENHDIKFKYKEQTKSQTVYWIYKHQEDEQHHQDTHIQAMTFILLLSPNKLNWFLKLVF